METRGNRAAPPPATEAPHAVTEPAIPSSDNPFPDDALPTLDTPRLRLRHVEPRDVPALFEVFGDAEVTRYWSHPPLDNPAAAEVYRADIEDGFQSRALFQWAVCARADDRLVGTCTLAGWSRPHRRAELGYALGRAHWGHGLAQEAVGAALRFGFGAMALHRVEADVDPENEASVRLLERLGFAREGLLRERWWTYGLARHTYLYGLLRTDAAARALGAGP